jgi:DNA-binding MarR family transcriptional regulator
VPRSKAKPDAQLLGKLDGAKQASVLQLLFRAARLLNERGVARVRDERGEPMRMAHTHLLPHIDFEGIRLGDLAAKAGLAKQTVGPIVAELEELGFVAVEADPEDKRAKRVRYTRRGTEALLDGLRVLREIEAELTTELGEEAMRTLHGLLVRLLQIVDSKPDS